MKKLISLLLISVLLCGVALGESAVGTLFDAAKELAFNTENVTLSAEAGFYYDGELFKLMHALYQQDGLRSFLSYMLDTPDLAGEMTTNGYIVLGLGQKSYAGDKYYGYYYENGTKESSTVLSTNPRTEAQLKLARLLAVSNEDLVQLSESEGIYEVKVGELPELVNSAVFFLVCDYVQDNYYRDLFNLYDYTYNKGARTVVEDWSALVAQMYKALYNDDMPEFDKIYDDETLSGRYEVAVNAANQFESEARAKYDDGVVYIKKDGSLLWYASTEEYMRQNGMVEVYYASWDGAFKHFYQVKYGEEITDETIDYVLYSPNQELWNAYISFMEEMKAYYQVIALTQNDKALSAVVLADGSVKTYDYIITSDETTTEHIFNTLAYAELNDLDAKIGTDEQGRLTAFAGTLIVNVFDKEGAKHELKVEFDCKAEDYGSTSVPDTFEPEKYGLISYEEYERKMNEKNDPDEYDDSEYENYWKSILENDPGSVKFGDKTYETMMSEYLTEDEEEAVG